MQYKQIFKNEVLQFIVTLRRLIVVDVQAITKNSIFIRLY